MNKKFRGFTLLELIIVVIIIGILASLGIANYGTTIERSRGAEAKMHIGALKSLGIAAIAEFGSITAGGDIRDAAGAPKACDTGHFFRYNASYESSTNILNLTAFRCNGTKSLDPNMVGKTPDRTAGGSITLLVNTSLTNNTNIWAGDTTIW